MGKSAFDHISDKDLLQQYLQDHDNKWLGILLQRYTLLLFGVCMKYLKNETEAQDAVQQVFLKVIQEVHKYKIDYFKSWLYTVAKNFCLSSLRSRKNNIPAVFSENIVVIEDEAPVQYEEVPVEILQKALYELNEEQRRCVTLFYLQKKSYQEISEEEGYSMLQVKSYIQNGKRNLKLLFQKKIQQAKEGNG